MVGDVAGPKVTGVQSEVKQGARGDDRAQVYDDGGSSRFSSRSVSLLSWSFALERAHSHETTRVRQDVVMLLARSKSRKRHREGYSNIVDISKFGHLQQEIAQTESNQADTSRSMETSDCNAGNGG